jgi:ABC-2 type transport system permease protein
MTLYGVYTIFRKELADHFSSYRFIILFAIIAMVSVIMVYMAGTGLRESLEGTAQPQTRFVFLKLFTSTGAVFSLSQFVAYFGPLIGLVLGFDAINRERSNGTLSKLVAQPIYRDAIINGKFSAGVATIGIMLAAIALIITGLGLLVLGIVPTVEEVLRLIFYLIISLFYIAFWLGLAILFSVFFRNVATSALASIALWIFFLFFVTFGAQIMANAIAPVEKNTATLEDVAKHYRTQRAISLVSPMALYSEASRVIIDPMRKQTSAFRLPTPLEEFSRARFQNPLPLLQSLLVVWPYITILLALTLVCFGFTYAAFMVQEVRAL